LIPQIYSLGVLDGPSRSFRVILSTNSANYVEDESISKKCI